MTPIIFRSTHCADFHEIDAYGHMNTLHYLNYFLKNRFEGMRDIGMGVLGASKLPIAFYMKDISLKFVRPVYADTPFTIESHVSDQNETTAFVKSQMIDNNKKVHATCDWTIVCVDKQTGKTCQWPNNFMDVFYE